MVALSVLDFQYPGAAVALASCADECGYTRLWLGEHHSGSQCANPLLLGALLAGVTERIRIGSGGASLTYSTPYRLAEDARLIESLLPGRFDLGVTRGMSNPGAIEQALLDGRLFSAHQYHDRLILLHGLLTGRLPEDHPLLAVASFLEPGPQLWILGMSARTAGLAGSLGTGFCFSLHHASPTCDCRATIDEYRRNFIPSEDFPEPVVIVVARCIAAETERAALALEARIPRSPSSQLPTVVGSADRCVEQLNALADQLEAQELMLLDFIEHDQDARLEMYRQIAKTAQLQPANANVS